MNYQNERTRLIEISQSLKRLEIKMNNYLKEYEQTSEWKRFKEGFLSINYNIKPKDVVHLRTCELKELAKSEFFPEKNKMIVCFNKLKDK